MGSVNRYGSLVLVPLPGSVCVCWWDGGRRHLPLCAFAACMAQRQGPADARGGRSVWPEHLVWKCLTVCLAARVCGSVCLAAPGVLGPTYGRCDVGKKFDRSTTKARSPKDGKAPRPKRCYGGDRCGERAENRGQAIPDFNIEVDEGPKRWRPVWVTSRKRGASHP